MGWVLTSPSGRAIEFTFDTDKDGSESKSFGYLYSHLNKSWAKPYWKQWDAFCAERERRGWRVVKAVVTCETDP